MSWCWSLSPSLDPFSVAIHADGRRVHFHRSIDETVESIADAVLTACDPARALFDLLDPPLTGPVADELKAARRGNVAQALVHVATDRLSAIPRRTTRRRERAAEPRRPGRGSHHSLGGGRGRPSSGAAPALRLHDVGALAAMEARAPGFRDSIVGVSPWTPLDMMRARPG